MWAIGCRAPMELSAAPATTKEDVDPPSHLFSAELQELTCRPSRCCKPYDSFWRTKQHGCLEHVVAIWHGHDTLLLQTIHPQRTDDSHHIDLRLSECWLAGEPHSSTLTLQLIFDESRSPKGVYAMHCRRVGWTCRWGSAFMKPRRSDWNPATAEKVRVLTMADSAIISQHSELGRFGKHGIL